MIGAGLAAIALAGAGVGIEYFATIYQVPEKSVYGAKAIPNLLLGFALAEATGLFGLVVALIILFAF